MQCDSQRLAPGDAERCSLLLARRHSQCAAAILIDLMKLCEPLIPTFAAPHHMRALLNVRTPTSRGTF
jgi:hypothetical protein